MSSTRRDVGITFFVCLFALSLGGAHVHHEGIFSKVNSFNAVLRKFKVLQGNFKAVSRLFKICFYEFARLFIKSFQKVVSRKIDRYLEDV